MFELAGVFSEIRKAGRLGARLLVAGGALLSLLTAQAQTPSTPAGVTPNWTAVPAVVSPPTRLPYTVPGAQRRATPLRDAPQTPQTVIYTNTSLTACPSGETLQYFWTYQDIPDFRGGDWCGPARADIAWANANETNHSRLPYQLESCTPGVSWSYSHRLSDTVRYTSPPIRDINMVCTRGPIRISLSGPGALYAGERGSVTAVVTQLGQSVPGLSINLGADQGVVGNCTAATDAAGTIACVYVAPDVATRATITANCASCVNSTVTASVLVMNPQVQQCTAQQAGTEITNPLLPATGDKLQRETDYVDAAAADPLHLQRIFKSGWIRGLGIPSAGLGAGWTHNHAASLSVEQIPTTYSPEGLPLSYGPWRATIQIGDEQTVFMWNGTSNWTPLRTAHQLTQDANGYRYIRADDESAWQFNPTGQLQSVTQRNGWVRSYSYSGNNLTQVTNPFGRSLGLSYDSAGNLTGATLPDGQTLSYTLDAAGRLTQVRYPGNASKTYVYEDTRFPAFLTGIIDELGNRFATYGYDQQGRAVSSEHAGGVNRHVITYDTGSNGATGVTVADPLGNQRGYTYGSTAGQLAVTGATQPFDDGSGTQAASRTQDFLGFLSTETDFLGVSTMYTWDITRRLPTGLTRAVGKPESQTRSTQWHATFRLPVLVTEPGRTTAYTYDSLGNKLSETTTDTAPNQATSQARTWAWTYNSQGLNDTMTDPKGAVWTYGYDTQGNRTSVKNPLNQTTGYSYDSAGRVLTQTQPNGLVTSYTYDARGRLTSQSQGTETTSYSYTAAGQIASATLPSGYQVSYSYDAAQRLTSANDNRGSSIQYTLDAMGNRTREEVKDQNGNIALATGRVINSLNKVAAIQGAAGQTTQMGYDANGEAISQTDPLNQTTGQTLDALRRPTATTFADNASAQQAWNQLDQLTQVTDPKGVATQYVYNAFGEVMSETSPDIGGITYTRDAAGNVSSQQDAKGNVTTITRDTLGRPMTIQYAPDHIASFSYDALGSVTRIDDRSGSTVYERDTQGRILSKTQTVNDNPANPSLFKVSYGYTNGDLTSITYPSGLKVFYGRTAGRITGINVQEPGGTVRNPKPITPWVTNLSYTALGQPKAWTWSNGDVANRTFDADGRMSSNEFASYIYDAASRITGITQNLWASRTVTSVVGTTTTTVSELYQTPLSWTAGYDSRNRLTSFTRDGAETRYTYDANSNRLSAIDRATSDTDLDGIFEQDDFTQATNQSLNIEGSSNRLLGFTQTVTTTNKGKTKSVVTTPVAYAVDANGSMTSDGLRTFDYDASNRLAKVKVLKDGEAASISYLHNNLGQRVFKGEPTAEQMLPNETALGTSFVDWLKKNFSWLYAQAQANTSIGTAYVYGGDNEIPAWAVLGEYDNGSAKGAGRTEYLWLPTEDGSAIPIGLYRGGKFFAIHSDHLGTPRLMTNEANTPVWQWPYSAFGNNRPTGVLKTTPNPKAAITNKPVLLRATAAAEMNLRFPGQADDVETGTFYNYFRSYEAKTGRYTQSDPIGLRGGINRFSYVRVNPLSYVDPHGLFDIDDIIPPNAPIWTMGRAYGGLAAYLVGKMTGDTALAKAAMEGLQCNRAGNTELLGLMMSIGRGGGKLNAPRSTLPRGPGGEYLPHPDAVGPHSTIGTRMGSNGVPYRQGATFDGSGNFRGRTDVTDHGSPQRPGHASPHYHPATGPASTGSATQGPLPLP